jgi:hypothetical protein
MLGRKMSHLAKAGCADELEGDPSDPAWNKGLVEKIARMLEAQPEKLPRSAQPGARA